MTEAYETGLFLTTLTGMGSRRLVEGFPIHPNVIKGLPTGQAVVIHQGLGVARNVGLVPMPRGP